MQTRFSTLTKGSLWLRRQVLAAAVLGGSFLLFPYYFGLVAQTPPATGVIRLKVKFKSGDTTRELQRKRFFLLKGSLGENQSLIEKLKQGVVLSRECYYRNHGASEALLKWLKENDCDSLYCREVEEKYLSGSEAVPEFQTAYSQGLRELKNAELARRWLTVNIPAELRDGFYREKQRAITSLITRPEQTISVMTDRKGTAYLTGLEPGIYTISNLVPTEAGKTTIIWACEREVKTVDLAIAMRRPLTLSNEKDPKVKCEIIERPLPVCNK